MLGVFLRNATVGDIGRLVELENDSFLSPWSYRSYRDEFGHAFSHIYVAEFDSNVVGYICFRIVAEECHLVKLNVDVGFRRCGIGRLLMKRMEDVCSFFNVANIVLDVEIGNHAAISLYKKIGFVNVNEHSNASSGQLLMIRRLK
jgi:ribosomal-protein-alanine N-acetyltransferase